MQKGHRLISEKMWCQHKMNYHPADNGRGRFYWCGCFRDIHLHRLQRYIVPRDTRYRVKKWESDFHSKNKRKYNYGK